MEILVVIPARSASTRFPDKPLAELTAADGTRRPLIEWTWRAACAAFGRAKVVVATDSEAIAERVHGFGGTAVLTSPGLRNGTERCAAVLAQLEREPEVLINLQGDSPLVPPDLLHALARRFTDPPVSVATPCVTCDAAMAARILAEARAGRVGGTCVVSDTEGRALYFSKQPIPHGAGTAAPLKLHLGVYAYRPAALRAYASWPPSPLELAEGLEQLRFLAAGWPVHVIEADLPAGGIWEVNNPSDVALVESLLPVEADPTAETRELVQ
jgi:3-deoxy-manno-octulosonate cytidylyltransferase (CMP-KDO synthetase)